MLMCCMAQRCKNRKSLQKKNSRFSVRRKMQTVAAMPDTQRKRTSWAAVAAGRANDVANATGVHRATVFRARATGDGIELAAAQYVSSLQRAHTTTAWPFITALQIEAKKAVMETKSASWLIQRFHQIRDELLPPAEMAVQVSARSGTREDERQARLSVIQLNVELNAVDERLQDVDVNPRDFNRYGHKIR